jgi:hypothetical protein
MLKAISIPFADVIPSPLTALMSRRGRLTPAAALSAFTARPNGYCFFFGVIGVTGCAPPVDFGPGVTPALFFAGILGLGGGYVGIWLRALRGPAAGVLCFLSAFRRAAARVGFRLRKRRGRETDGNR